MSRLRLLVALLSVSLLACDGPTAPSLPVALSWREIGTRPDTATIHVSHDTLRLSHSIGLSEPCYTLSAGTAVAADTLVLAITATRGAGGCRQVLATFSYAVTVVGLRAELRVLRLLHIRVGPRSYTEIAWEHPL